MQTVIHVYQFDVRKPAEKAAYAALREKLKAGPRCMRSWGNGPGHYEFVKALDGQVVELETTHLFDNQWNTAPNAVSDKGLRVFDWAQDAPGCPGIPEWMRRGHWLEQTAEMREIRRNTMKCGYCGKQEPAAKGYVFCPHCIDSAYLKEADLFLTRMRPIDRSGPGADFPALTDAEKAHLLPLYREAQLHGTTERGKARIAKARRDIEEKYQRETRNAKIEHDDTEVQVWHLLYSLLEYCEHAQINFEATLTDAKAEYAAAKRNSAA